MLKKLHIVTVGKLLNPFFSVLQSLVLSFLKFPLGLSFNILIDVLFLFGLNVILSSAEGYPFSVKVYVGIMAGGSRLCLYNGQGIWWVCMHVCKKGERTLLNGSLTQ